MKRFVSLIWQGIVPENPLLILMIGLCSALAVTNTAANAVGMGVAMTFVLLFSELIISIFRKVIPNAVRIPIFIVVIASFTTIIDLLMQAYAPELSKSMGVFIPLIVVNCIIMGRVEAFASKEGPVACVADSIGMGVGYTWVLVGIASVREILGNGTFFGLPVFDFIKSIVPDFRYQKILFFTMSPGGFLVFALFISINIALKKSIARKAELRAAKEAS